MERDFYEEGARAWPRVAVPIGDFVAYVEARATGPGGAAALHHADLYLACACAHGLPGAIESFDRAHLTRIPSILARMRPSPELVDEVRQAMREKLFVGRDGASGRIAEYDGRGALASWVRVVAMRTAIDLRRQRGGIASAVDSRVDAPGTAPSRHDPEIAYIKRGYRRAFDEAFRAAVTCLDPDQRQLLYWHFVEGLTLDQLAARLGVHRATVARRIATGREAIADEARRLLGNKLGATKAELESIVALLRTHSEVSLADILRGG